MDQSEAMWPEELCTICYIIPKIHWFLCICMKFEKVNISNNSVWKYHGRLKLLHTSVCFCFFFFFFIVFFCFVLFVVLFWHVGCIFVLIFGVDCTVLIFCPLHCIVFLLLFFCFYYYYYFFWFGGFALS
jgi:hypothetical protein